MRLDVGHLRRTLGFIKVKLAEKPVKAVRRTRSCKKVYLIRRAPNYGSEWRMQMDTKSELTLKNPPGVELQAALLQEFESGLDPLNPEKSKIPCHVLGYGEISTVFEIRADGFQDLALSACAPSGPWKSCKATLRPISNTTAAWKVSLVSPACRWLCFIRLGLRPSGFLHHPESWRQGR